MSKGLRRIAAVLCALAAIPPALAKYPDRPIRIIVAFPAGGTNDTAARVVVEKMQGLLDQPVIVENRPGAGGMIGAEYVAASAADGYTLLMASGGHTVLPSQYKSMRYSLSRDFVPVGLVCTSGYALVVNGASPAHNVAELLALGRKLPNFTYASTGTGLWTHLAGEWFKQITGLNSIHVPYKGDAPALNDQLGGHVNYSILSITPVLPHVKQGTLRVLAVTSNTRSSALPEVPTLAEALKTPNFNIATWFGLLAPAKTPADIVNRLAGTTQKILAMPDVQQRFEDQAMEVAHVSPQEFGAMIQADTERATKIARSIGIKPE